MVILKRIIKEIREYWVWILLGSIFAMIFVFIKNNKIQIHSESTIKTERTDGSKTSNQNWNFNFNTNPDKSK